MSPIFLVLSIAASEPFAVDSIDRTLLDLEHDPRRIVSADGQSRTHLTNRETGLRAYLHDDGTLSLEDRERADAYQPVALTLDGFDGVAAPELHDDAVVLHGTGITQHLFNTPRGVQQVFVVFREELAVADELVLTMRVSGLRAQAYGVDGVAFADADGPRVKYAGLAAFDADHQQQTAWFVAGESTVEIHVETANARWPITVDPIASTFSTDREGAAFTDEFGAALAVGRINNDAFDDLVVGAPSFDPGGGADPGGVFVLFGSATGLQTTIGSAFTAANSSGLGAAVAVGDLDGDGDDDVAAPCVREVVGFSGAEPVV